MLLIGLFHGFPRHYFYITMDQCIPARTVMAAATKVFLDQTLLSVFIGASFLYGISLLEGQSQAEAMKGLDDKFPQVYLCDWMFWPPVQMINFIMVPTRFRVLYVNVMNLVWCTILSYFQHQYQKG